MDKIGENLRIFMLDGGRFRGAVLDATAMIIKMRESHGTGILETYALGETYIAAGLMTSMLKGRDRLAVVFECGGPIKGISVEVTADGRVRGYLANNPIPLDTLPEDLDLSMLFGPGFLSVTKYLESSKQPFTGKVMINYGSVAKDLAYYYTVSENTPTAFNLSVKFNKDGSIKGAGGLFVQVMPHSQNDEQQTEALQNAVVSMPSIGDMLADGMSAGDIISRNFSEFNPDIIGSRSIDFSCSCTRSLFENYLKGLAAKDKSDIVENGPFPLVTVCHNCNKKYSFTKKELLEIFNSRN